MLMKDEKKTINLVNIVIYVSGLRKRMNVYSFFFLFVILSFPNDSEMVSMSYFFNVFKKIKTVT